MMEHFPFNTHQTPSPQKKKKEGVWRRKKKHPCKCECKLVILKQIMLHLIIFSIPPYVRELP